MSVRDLIRSGRNENQIPAAYHGTEQSPFLALHREVNRLFDDVFRAFDLPAPFARASGWAGNWPNIEISETDKEIRVSADVPGLEENDIEVLLQDGILTLRGEKRSQTEDKDRHFSERFYGRFERSIPVGADVDEEKVNASFANGVLNVTLPKTERAQSKTRRIAINTGKQ